MPFSPAWFFIGAGLVLVLVGFVLAMRARRVPAQRRSPSFAPALIAGLGAGLFVPSVLVAAGVL